MTFRVSEQECPVYLSHQLEQFGLCYFDKRPDNFDVQIVVGSLRVFSRRIQAVREYKFFGHACRQIQRFRNRVQDRSFTELHLLISEQAFARYCCNVTRGFANVDDNDMVAQIRCISGS